MKKGIFGKGKEKYVKDKFIVTDNRGTFKFDLFFRKGQGEILRPASTRAESYGDAVRLVTSVANEVAREDGFDSVRVVPEKMLIAA